MLIAVPVGVASAVNRGRPIDSTHEIFSLIGYAVPDFFLGAVLLIVFALNLDGSRSMAVATALPTGFGTSLAGADLGLIKAAFVSRLTRSSLLEVSARITSAQPAPKAPASAASYTAMRCATRLLPVITGLGLEHPRRRSRARSRSS